MESHGDYTFALPHVLFVTVTFPPRRLWPHPSPAFGDTTPLEGRIRRRAARCFGSRVNGRSSCRNNPSGVTLPYVWATRAHAPIHVNAPFKPAAPNAGGMKFGPHITELLQPIHFHTTRRSTLLPCARAAGCSVGQRQQHILFGGARNAVFDMRGQERSVPA